MDMQQLHEEVQAISVIVTAIESAQEHDRTLIKEHDKILVRGNGVPSLQESFRVLNKSFSDFVVEVREERQKRVDAETAEAKRKKEELNKWKWTLIGVCITVIPPFLAQALYFWVTFVPLTSKLKTLP